MSETTIEKQRVQITLRIPGLNNHEDKQLKTYLQGFLWQRGLGCQIERVRHSVDDNDATTVVLFEGASGDVYQAKRDMIGALSKDLPQVVIPLDDSNSTATEKNWFVEPSTEELAAASIVKTQDGIRRDNSSGVDDNIVPIELAKIQGRGSSRSSILSHLLKVPGVSSLSRALQLSGKMKEVLVTVYYRNCSVSFDAAAKDWKAFLDTCSNKLKIMLPIKKVWHSVDDGWAEVSDIEAIVNGHVYRITAGTDPDLPCPSQLSRFPASQVPAFESMEEFYSRLKPLLRKEARDKLIENIQEIFNEQEIGVEILPDLTDDDLKEYGLKQGGLRKAVLKALRK
ncbi:hypothetical protein MP638_003636 [Amoeboaphelidium occidentale]|nr:hypothetical protein MP638_003636 [Amoeboaphelidium occidentale]